MVQKEEPKQQLIAHDSDVYDIAFAKGVFVFASMIIPILVLRIG